MSDKEIEIPRNPNIGHTNKVQGILNAKCINVWVAQSLLLCVLCFTKGLVSIAA